MDPSKPRQSFRGGNPNTLLVIVVDVSPLAWGERDVKRAALDRARKKPGPPTVLPELLTSIQALGNGILNNLERHAALIVVAVAESHVTVVFPRPEHLTEWLDEGGGASSPIDPALLPELLLKGVAELMGRTSAQEKSPTTQLNEDSSQAAMASGFSTALCLINRLLLVAQAGGVSALPPEHYLDRVEDQGVIAMQPKSQKGPSAKGKSSAWSPRILLVQASDDRGRDYNAMMNCAFSALKNEITVDACFLAASREKASPFLEQVCDLTGGVYSVPKGMTQSGGALTEVLLAIFLAPRPVRSLLHLPQLTKVDLRARCFVTGRLVDMATVCNICLSIFARPPTSTEGSVATCPTCHSEIAEE